MPLTETIRAELTAAMKAGDASRRDALRLIVASLHNARIAAGHDLDDDEALRVLQREAKQRRDSIEEFRKGNREDLIRIEEAELAIITSFLPAELSDDELGSIVRDVIGEVGASGPGDLGKVMGPVMGRVAGRADGKRANAMVRELLTGTQ
jgi:uncharacterized protein YqeY